MNTKAISRVSLILLVIMLGGMLAGCRKNVFTLEGKIEGGESTTIYLSWRAASGTRDFLASQAVPLTSTAFKVEGPVKRPSVIWIFSSGRSLLSAIYVERGNSLTLSGKMNEPRLWQVSGNEVMEEVSAWAQSNAPALKAGSTAGINSAVAAYVKANPGSRAALFLLLTTYDRNGAEQEFTRLLNLFKEPKCKPLASNRPTPQ